MRFKLAVSLFIATLFTSGLAFGQGGAITLDAVDTISTGIVDTGTAITFSIRWSNNSGAPITGFTNGFRIYSPDGATWFATDTGAFTGAITTGMVENTFINYFSVDGSGADTIGFGGFRLFAPGVPSGFSAVVNTITIDSIPATSIGKQICIDSSYYRPAGIWKWSTSAGDVLPSWDGPHCFTIGAAPPADLPPVLAAIGPQAVTECASVSFGVSATDPQGYALTLTATGLPASASFADNGNGTGSFTWVPVAAGDAGVYNVTFTATAATSGLSDAEIVTITVNPNQLATFVPSIPNSTVVAGNLLSYTVTAVDPEGGTMTLMADSLPVGATFIDNGNGTGDFSWTPTIADTGIYYPVYIVIDDCGNGFSETGSITVTPPLAPSSITLDAVSNGWSVDSIMTGVPVRFDLRLTNNSGSAITGLTNGFRVYSPTGANWTTTVPDTTGTITPGMMENIFINQFSIDGMGADTVGFGGFRLFSPGIPSGFNDVVYSITIGPIDPVYCGGQICLDSAFYPPASPWKWSTSGGDVLPDWDGPHCFTVYDSSCIVPQCTFSVAPNVLSFVSDTCSANPPCQWFTVGGDCPVDSVLSFSNWMTVILDSGRTYMVCANTVGMNPGQLSDTAFVYSSLAGSSPLAVIVNLQVDTCSRPVVPSLITVNRIDSTECSATFRLRMTNNSGANITGLTNGFRVYSPTGGTWDTTTAALTGTITLAMMENFFVNEFSTDGMGEDTIGFGGFRMLAPGIPAGFDTVAYDITIGPIPAGQGPQQFCIDSSFYPPAGIWKWSTSGGDVFPDWGGPYCVWLDCAAACSLSVPAVTTIDVCQYQDPACYSINPGCAIDSFTIASGVAWDFVSMAGDSLVICPLTANLAVGSYEDTINIWSSQAANSPAITRVIVNVTDTGTCSPCPPADCFTGVVETGISYPFLIHSELSCGLSSGDEIGLFDGELLVGSLVYCRQNYPLVVNAWGADPTHQLPGYTPGNSVTIKVCKQASGDILCATPYGSCLLFDECTFGIIDSLECHSCCVSLCTDILPDRWRTVSFPANPLVDACGGQDITCDPAAIFGGLNNLDIVKDDHGGVYIPAFGVNTLGCIEYCEGYDLFKYNAIEPLCIVGMPIAPAPCLIQANRWNILGYPLMCQMPIDVALASIASQIDIVKDDDGGVYIPDFFVNTIGNMIPGKGYKTFLKGPGDVSLQYPSCVSPVTMITEQEAFSKQVRPQTKHYKFVETGLNYPVVIEGIGDLIKAGDEIAVFDGDICVGAAIYRGEKTLVVPTWKSDSDHNLTGYTPGNLMDVRFYQDTRGESSLLSGADVFRFEERRYAVIDASKKSTLPTAYSLSQNYPNPFNPSTTFGFALPKAGYVTLEVFNVLGRRVATLVDQYHEAGSFEVTWNVQTDGDRSVSTGMYMYRLQVNGYVETRKLMILK